MSRASEIEWRFRGQGRGGGDRFKLVPEGEGPVSLGICVERSEDGGSWQFPPGAAEMSDDFCLIS